MSCSLPSATSSARERELFRYYQPVDAPEPIQNGDHPAPKAAADPCLTAFAQLGALRLNAKRGLITLSTTNTEYILAEAGQRLSLQKDDDEEDKLWHGAGILMHQNGMGPAIADMFSAPEAPDYIYVGDLLADDRYKNKPKVAGPPFLRAIACVPLKTPLHGIVIGTYIVLDDKPRTETQLGARNIEFLKDMAITIMDYLEAGRMKRQQFRAERMVKAIGLFIEGKSSLREWWLDHGHKYAAVKKRNKDANDLVKEADREFGVQEVTDYFSRTTLSGLNENTPRSSGPPSPSSSGISGDRGDGRPVIPRGDTFLSDTVGSTTLVSKSWHERNSSVTTFDTLTEQTPDVENRPSVSFDLPPQNPPGELSRDLQNAVLSSEVKGVFARSSNLIREAIGVEGVIYFDASVGSFGGSSDKSVMEEKAPGAFHADKALISSEDDFGKKLSDNENGEEAKQCTEQAPESNEKYCNVLGFSTRRRSTLRGHAVSEEHQRLPEMVLRKLLKRYPHGKVFNFDEEGSFSASESDNKPSLTLNGAQPVADDRSEAISRRNRISREAEAAAILRVLPGARSVFWFPLWDQNRERWFAGSLVWSTCAMRTLCPVEDITYLAAFGNSTMAEIARLSAAVLSKMKTDFISSISHELRSPLHGVLASVEFLQETDMTEVQADMVSNIHASGKVLLDTINHVLDFSKVNRKTKDRKRMPKRKSPKKGGRRQSVDATADVEKEDICILSEEVIESIYAGRSIGKKAFDSMGNRQRNVSISKDSPITIIVDINWRPNWTFEIDAGAWRRVLMNLFSNALKYTKQGFVKVSMEIEDDVASQKKISRSNLTLKVRDSGKGISQEFLRHQLYKPFTQEDTLATGAGLGLSIVKAIIQDLGGRIDFVSEPGTGTEATVRIPLTAAASVEMEKLKIVNEVREKTKGLKFRLDGFERYPDISETPTGILSADAEAAMLLKSSVHYSLTEWFGMDAPSSPDATGVDVVVLMEAGLADKSPEEMLQLHPHREERTIAIVLTSSYHSGPKVDSHNHFRIFYLQQPNGPHKLATILHQAFCQPYSIIPLPNPNFEPPALLAPPTNSLLDARNLSPTSATHDFASIVPPKEMPPANPAPLHSETSKEAPISESRSETHQGEAPPTPSTPIAPTVTVQQEDGMRVLLVEDNEINLKLLVATMRKLKLDHVTATNGLEALNSYKDCDGKFDVIFMDISMPIMSGIESTRHIRRFEKEKSLKPVALIALTGAANPSTRQEAFSSGVDLFLTKPVPMKALRGMLDDLRREGRSAFAG